MSLRIKCRSCKTAFLAADELLGKPVACPKCGERQLVPSTALSVESTPKKENVFKEAPSSVFVPASEKAPKKGRRGAWLAVLLLLVTAGVGGVVGWPWIKAWLHPVPPDPIEVTATSYLQSLVDGNNEVSHQLSTVEDPPGIRGFGSVTHAPQGDRSLKGNFKPIAELHKRIDKDFEYIPAIGRFQTRNPLGPAAETLDALHDPKMKAESEEIAKKIQSGNPDDLFDAAEKLGGTFAKMAETLTPKKLVPTYAQLVEESKPPLPDSERELAMDFGANHATWDALLKRPFPTLKADGPYVHDRAEVTAKVTNKLASSGDPPVLLHLKLVRFRLEGIDTGWKIVSARREGDEPPPPVQPAEPPPAPPTTPSKPEKPSPGETTP